MVNQVEVFNDLEALKEYDIFKIAVGYGRTCFIDIFGGFVVLSHIQWLH